MAILAVTHSLLIQKRAKGGGGMWSQVFGAYKFKVGRSVKIDYDLQPASSGKWILLSH